MGGIGWQCLLFGPGKLRTALPRYGGYLVPVLDSPREIPDTACRSDTGGGYQDHKDYVKDSENNREHEYGSDCYDSRDQNGFTATLRAVRM
jgi:hypothetical protein